MKTVVRLLPYIELGNGRLSLPDSQIASCMPYFERRKNNAVLERPCSLVELNASSGQNHGSLQRSSRPPRQLASLRVYRCRLLSQVAQVLPGQPASAVTVDLLPSRSRLVLCTRHQGPWWPPTKQPETGLQLHSDRQSHAASQHHGTGLSSEGQVSLMTPMSLAASALSDGTTTTCALVAYGSEQFMEV